MNTFTSILFISICVAIFVLTGVLIRLNWSPDICTRVLTGALIGAVSFLSFIWFSLKEIKLPENLFDTSIAVDEQTHLPIFLDNKRFNPSWKRYMNMSVSTSFVYLPKSNKLPQDSNQTATFLLNWLQYNIITEMADIQNIEIKTESDGRTHTTVTKFSPRYKTGDLEEFDNKKLFKAVFNNPFSRLDFNNFDLIGFQPPEFGGSLDKINPLLEKLGQPLGKFKDFQSAIDWLNTSTEPFKQYLKFIEKNDISKDVSDLAPSKFETFTEDQLKEFSLDPLGRKFKRAILNQFYPHETPIPWAHWALLLPKGTSLSLQSSDSFEQVLSQRKILLNKPDYFHIEITIKPIFISEIGYKPEGINIDDELVKNCKTYTFVVKMNATFERITSKNSLTEKYIEWIQWLFSEIKKENTGQESLMTRRDQTR